MQKITIIDAHVHIHPNFELNKFINSAFKNFGNFVTKSFSGHNYTGVLCLTESAGVNYFEKLSHINSDNWKVSNMSKMFL